MMTKGTIAHATVPFLFAVNYIDNISPKFGFTHIITLIELCTPNKIGV
jgi:hypothetical protein